MQVSQEDANKQIQWTWVWQQMNFTTTPTTTCGALDQMTPYVVAANDDNDIENDSDNDADVCAAIQSHAPVCCTPASGTLAPTFAPTLQSTATAVTVSSSFVVLVGEEGRDGATRQKRPALHILAEAFILMVEQIILTADNNDPPRQRRQLRSWRRHLSVILDLESPQLYKLEDVPCPTDSQASANATCQLILGSYGLLLVEESDPEGVVATYRSRTNTAINQGRLQQWLDTLDPNSTLTVLGTTGTIPAPLRNDDLHRDLAIGFGVGFVILLVLTVAAAVLYCRYLRHDKACCHYLGKDSAKTDSLESFLDANDRRILRYKHHEDDDDDESDISPSGDKSKMAPQLPDRIIEAFRSSPDTSLAPPPKLPKRVVSAFVSPPDATSRDKDVCRDVPTMERKSLQPELQNSPMAAFKDRRDAPIDDTTMAESCNTSTIKASQPELLDSPMGDALVSPRDAISCSDHGASPCSQEGGDIAKILFEQRELDVWEENPGDIETQLLTQMTMECTSIVDSCATGSKNQSWLEEDDYLNISADHVEGHVPNEGAVCPDSKKFNLDGLCTGDGYDEPKLQAPMDGSPAADHANPASPATNKQADRVDPASPEGTVEDNSESDGHGSKNRISKQEFSTPVSLDFLEESYSPVSDTMEDTYSEGDSAADGEDIVFETLASGAFPDADWEGTSSSASSEDLARELCFEGQRGHIGFPSP